MPVVNSESPVVGGWFGDALCCVRVQKLQLNDAASIKLHDAAGAIE